MISNWLVLLHRNVANLHWLILQRDTLNSCMGLMVFIKVHLVFYRDNCIIKLKAFSNQKPLLLFVLVVRQDRINHSSHGPHLWLTSHPPLPPLGSGFLRKLGRSLGLMPMQWARLGWLAQPRSYLLKKVTCCGWRDGSIAKSTGISSRE